MVDLDDFYSSEKFDTRIAILSFKDSYINPKVAQALVNDFYPSPFRGPGWYQHILSVCGSLDYYQVWKYIWLCASNLILMFGSSIDSQVVCGRMIRLLTWETDMSSSLSRRSFLSPKTKFKFLEIFKRGGSINIFKRIYWKVDINQCEPMWPYLYLLVRQRAYTLTRESDPCRSQHKCRVAIWQSTNWDNGYAAATNLLPKILFKLNQPSKPIQALKQSYYIAAGMCCTSDGRADTHELSRWWPCTSSASFSWFESRGQLFIAAGDVGTSNICLDCSKWFCLANIVQPFLDKSVKKI